MNAIVRDPEILELLGDTPRQGNAPVPGSRRVLPGTGEHSIAGDAHEGASHTALELARWNPVRRSADRDIIPEKPTIDARTRDMVRNDPQVMGGANLHRDNIVGSQYTLNAKPMSITLFGKEDSVWESEFQEEVEERFTLWAESPENWVDASRMTSFTGLIRQAVGMYVMFGEVLASVEWRRDDAPQRPFKTCIQMIDIDRLDTPPEWKGDRRVAGGVRTNSFNQPLGYYIRMAHPTDWATPDAHKWRYVERTKPWGRMQMLHLFEATRAGQTRGMSQMASALKEMRMTKNFKEMVLQKAVINATYAATIESDLAPEAIFSRLAGGSVVDAETIQEALTDYIGAHYTTMQKFMGGAKNLDIGGSRIPHLPPGSKLQLRGASDGGPLGGDFEASLLRGIAAALDVSYEQLSRDYTNTNYSSARAAMTETWKAMQARKAMGPDRFATHIYRLWLEEVINSGQLHSMKRKMPSWYEGQNKDAYSACDWVGASRGQIDELKETEAAVLRIKNNLSTVEDETARLGKDWRKIYRQKAREKDWEEELGIEPTESSAGTSSSATGQQSDSEDDADKRPVKKAPAKQPTKKKAAN